MSVTVRFVNGTQKTYSAADTAENRDGIFVLSKWNRLRRKLEEIEAMDARSVTLAEISKNGQVTNIVLGSGQARPKPDSTSKVANKGS